MNALPTSPPTASGLRLTEAAVQQLATLLATDAEPGWAVRLYIQGGGCSGFTYQFAYEDTIAADDTLIEETGARLVVDPVSLPYLAGATLDYQASLGGSAFVVQNPNARSTCGCGSSFAA